MSKILYALIFLLVGCATPATYSEEDIINCCNDALEYYGDLGAESSSGYEVMSYEDAHFEGVKRGVEGVRDCLGIETCLWLLDGDCGEK